MPNRMCKERGTQGDEKVLLEVMSLEVSVESVGTVAGVQSWRQRVPNFRKCDREVMLMSHCR